MSSSFYILILGQLLTDGDIMRLKSWKGDYLNRPDTENGVTMSSTGVGTTWKVVRTDRTIQLKSWKGDFLNRPNTDIWSSLPKITTGPTGPGSSWTVTWIGNKTSFRSWKGDCLHRPASGGVTTWHTGIGNRWSVEIIKKGELGEYQNSSER